MASIMALAAELKLFIIDHLDPETDLNALLSLGCTCSTFRTLTTPKLFKTLVLHNNEKSAASIQTLADGPYKDQVNTLHYKGIIAIPPAEMNRGIDDPPPLPPNDQDLPTSARHILSNVKQFPKLEKLIVEFPFSEEDLMASFYLFEEEEVFPYETRQKETTEGWRNFIARSYEAVAANEPGSLKHLELRNIIPMPSTPWDTKAYYDLLGGLESVTLTLLGGDNGAGWSINTLEGYIVFAISLEVIRSPLMNVRHFSLGATPDGPLGLEGGRHIPWPLYRYPTHMPQLQTLALQWFFICPDLVNFIRAHKDTLQRVFLTNCYSGDSSDAHDGFTWARFLSAITEDLPQNLVEFSVLPLEVPIRDDYTAPGTLDYEKVEKEVKENPKRRLFAYGYLSDKYGTLFDDRPMNFQEYILGEDQQAWDQLMAIVERNASMSVA